MDKLDKKIVDYLQKLIKTCSISGIENIAIESNVVRGTSEDHLKGIFLIEENNIPSLPFTSIGLGRLKILGARINLLGDENFAISYIPLQKDNGDTIAKKLILSNKKTKIEYSCYDSARIKAPKAFKDDFVYFFKMNDDTLKIMSRALAAIETSNVSFSSCDDGTVKFLAVDTTGDNFDHLVSSEFIIDEDKAPKSSFFFSYQIKYVLPLFKAAMDEHGEVDIAISTRGILKIIVNGFSIHILSEH